MWKERERCVLHRKKRVEYNVHKSPSGFWSELTTFCDIKSEMALFFFISYSFVSNKISVKQALVQRVLGVAVNTFHQKCSAFIILLFIKLGKFLYLNLGKKYRILLRFYITYVIKW